METDPFLQVREFKGKTYIDIREYYTDKKTMDMMPGKKGVSLNCEQYQKLKSIISEIDRALPEPVEFSLIFYVNDEVRKISSKFFLHVAYLPSKKIKMFSI